MQVGKTAADTFTADAGETSKLTGGASFSVAGGTSAQRSALVDQFNNLRAQINRAAQDAGFNGTNLLAGDSYGTKACVIADGRGRAVAFRIAPGQAHELPHAIPLLDQLPGVPKWVVGDRGYSSHGFREHIWTTGARPAIPTKSNEEQLACRGWAYNNRI